MTARRAGVSVPLFSFPSTSSWGIGEIVDIVPMARWLAGAGQRVLQLLPLNEMASGQASPYSALSGSAIDPIFIHVPAISEFAALGGESVLDADERAMLEEARSSSRVEYALVRRLKQRALALAFERFRDHEWRGDTDRARAFRAYRDAQAWWIDDYALFRAIRATEGDHPWLDWPEPLRNRTQSALDEVRRNLWREILFYQYLQWIADLQWQAARASAESANVALFGDLPFMVDGDSADVWARPGQFNLDVSVGAPPDPFSETGQDWGMPACRWDVMAGGDFRWLRERARRSAALYHGYRVDHLVGFYRTFARRRDTGEPSFSPASEPEQLVLGERLLHVLAEAGADIIAEDLGTVPDFVRASLARLEIPGFRVLRWERYWKIEAQPFRDPGDYPAVSVASSGTHDTEPMATWWDQASEAERQAICELPTCRRLTHVDRLERTPFNPVVRDALLEVLCASGSRLALHVIQDVFGWRDRINEPSTVNDRNWTFRLPWPSDRLDSVAEARERQAALLRWSREYKRT